MKPVESHWARFFPILFLLPVMCASPPETEAPQGDKPVRWLHSVGKDTENLIKLRNQAETFDKFLRQELSPEELVILEDSCVGAPERNVFCFSILNYEYFDEKLKARAKVRRRKRYRRVKPQFRRGRVKNWAALKFSRVTSMISPVAGLSPKRFATLKKKAFKDKTCPLNVAIALAAALEDKLPGGSSLDEIAKLYEKGADCLKKDRGDRASLLTRAGLFYFLNKNHQKAFDVFLKASWVPNIVNSRPLYWKHRAELVLGKKEDAKATLQTLSEKYPFSFHTLVANTAAKLDPGSILEQPHTKSVRSQQVPAINLLIEQVEILSKFGLEDSARLVLDWAVMESDGVEPEVKIYLAELKHQEGGNHLEKIKLLTNVLLDNPNLISKKAMEYYFPKPFFPVFEKHSSGVDPYLLLAIARQESAFNPQAVSAANALGLLQVIPATGRIVTNASKTDLLTPEGNIQAGSKYFQNLLQSLGGQLHLSMMAYNAGPKRLDEWLKRYQTDDPILFIDIIPYSETRNYVALVLRNYYWYRRMHGTDSDHSEISRVLELKQKYQ